MLQLTTEDWKAFKAEYKQKRQELALKRIVALEALVNKYNLKCVKMADNYFRISKPGKPTIDFYALSGKFNIVGSAQYKPERMQYFLTLHYIN